MLTVDVLKSFKNHIEKIATAGMYNWINRQGRTCTTHVKIGLKSPGKDFTKEKVAGKDSSGKHTWVKHVLKKNKSKK